MLQQQSLRGKWCISQRLSRHTSKLYSLFVRLVTAHIKERFLDLLGWRCIDVLLSILSFPSQPHGSCQVQVCFLPFLRAHKFFRWLNVDIIAQVTELWRGVFLLHITYLWWFDTTLTKTKHVENAFSYLKLLSAKRIWLFRMKSVLPEICKTPNFTNFSSSFIKQI